MPKFLIERRLPGAGQLSQEELKAISQKSNSVLGDLTRKGHDVHWIESYVTDDAIHCVYYASDSGVIREHAQCGGFPCDNIMEVGTMINPTTGE